ncbi:Cell surface glycan-binding lipoprotein, utilization system for glycans and polysaccharides (PUL), SusD family [hydrothermal vent metagenome]|uniref:Cell surface glycan-binding lipoprotein, utilization system for glycans and polysaccharides (PUL), SusD family n=1 Tax=hydrothermal vent metagenome TaxID=652676 RepID=A0A3B0U0K1_9ZZZZ
MKIKMKSIFNFLLAIILVSVLFSGCTEDFEEINTDTRVLAELDKATIGNVYAYCQYRGLMNGWSFQTSQNLFADLYSQYYSNVQTKFPSDRYILVGGWLDGAWSGFYGNAAANMAVILKETDPENDVAGMETQHALLQIWKVFMYQRITDYWGPIPYSQVGNGESSVGYDSQESIYNDFFVLLDDALSVLDANSGKNAFGSHDQIYGGDINSWRRFANTLRLRVAMRISYVNPSKAKAEAEKAIAGGVIESNDQNAIFKTTPNSWNALNIMLPWNEFRMSASMESVLKGYDDPRLPSYFSPTAESAATGSPVWKGLRNGYDIPGLSAPDLHYDKLSSMGPRWSDPTDKGKNPIEVMLASEAYFLRAEGALNGWSMGGSAEEFYNKGIEMSLSFWGVDAATIAAYQQSMNTPVATHDAPEPMTDIPVKFASSADKQLEQIITQKWLGLYPDGWEAWADVRRTEFPKLYDRLFSDNPDVAKNETMRRIDFVDNEFNTNAEGVEAAKSLLGGPDNGATRLWWNVKK